MRKKLPVMACVWALPASGGILALGLTWMTKKLRGAPTPTPLMPYHLAFSFTQWETGVQIQVWMNE